MAGAVPSKDIYPAIEQMLANCRAWVEEQKEQEQRLADSCEIVNVPASSQDVPA